MKVKGLVIWLGGKEKDKMTEGVPGLGIRVSPSHRSEARIQRLLFHSDLEREPVPSPGEPERKWKRCCPASPQQLLLQNFHTGHTRCSKSSFPRDPEPHQQPHQETGQPEGLKKRGGERKWIGPARLIPDNHCFYVGPPMVVHQETSACP